MASDVRIIASLGGVLGALPVHEAAAADQSLAVAQSASLPLYASIIMIGVVTAIVIAVICILLLLGKGKWNLREALSEDPISSPAGAISPAPALPAPAAQGVGGPVAAPSSGPAQSADFPSASRLGYGPASSSRLIAMLGMAVILILFTGVGITAIAQLAMNKKVDLSGFQSYFVAGASLFVPYVFNQLSNIGK